MSDRKIILIVDNVRSAHNVGSILRTADAMAIETVYLVGVTPYPLQSNDQRLPHIATKANTMISKTALGAEKSVPTEHLDDDQLLNMLSNLKTKGYTIASLEQTEQSQSLNSYQPADLIALIVGNEVDGLPKQLTEFSDICLQIPMLGSKESLNVAVATGIALHHLRFEKG